MDRSAVYLIVIVISFIHHDYIYMKKNLLNHIYGFSHYDNYNYHNWEYYQIFFESYKNILKQLNVLKGKKIQKRTKRE